MPPPLVYWSSPLPATHGDVWLPSLIVFPVSVSRVPTQHVLRAAVLANLGRYRGESRSHTAFDLRILLRSCTDQDRDPLAVVWVDIERCLHWQDLRRCRPHVLPPVADRGRLRLGLRD